MNLLALSISFNKVITLRREFGSKVLQRGCNHSDSIKGLQYLFDCSLFLQCNIRGVSTSKKIYCCQVQVKNTVVLFLQLLPSFC